MEIYDTVDADQVEPGDLIVIEGQQVEVTSVFDEDPYGETILIKGYSHSTGDIETFEVLYIDSFDLWSN